VANHKGGQENRCRRMVNGILELVVESSRGMLAMVVRDGRDDTTHKKKIKHHKRKEKATHQRVVAQTKA
jgi:hypothetical protein